MRVELDPETKEAIKAEQAQLQACHDLLRASAPGEAEGIFGPGSAMWQYTKDIRVPLVGVRAVMLQIAHPAVAAAGVQNSRFMENFLPRAWRTFSSMYVVQFGSLSEALQSAKRVHAMHTRVRGTIPPEASQTNAGRAYTGNRPELLLWVLSTMFEGIVFAYDLMKEPMPEAEQERLYQDMRRLGLALALPLDASPPDIIAFRRYFDRMLAEADLDVGKIARDLSTFLFTKGWSIGQFDEIWAAGLLPPRFRDAYGLPWNAARSAAHHAMRRAMLRSARRLPVSLREAPAYHQACMRVALARGEKPSLTSRTVNWLDDRAQKAGYDLPLSLQPIQEAHDR